MLDKLGRLYEFFARKDLTPGCRVYVKGKKGTHTVDSYGMVVFENDAPIYLSDQNPHFPILTPIGHPVIIGDILQKLWESIDTPAKHDYFYNIQVPLILTHWNNFTQPLDKQSKWIQNHLYSLIK